MNEHCSAVFAAIEKRNRARGDAKTANPQEESKLNPLEVSAGYESNSDETHLEDPSNTVEDKVTQPSQKTISPKISLKDALFLQPWPKNVMQCFRKRIRNAAYPPGSGGALARNFRQKKRFSTAEEFLAFARRCIRCVPYDVPDTAVNYVFQILKDGTGLVHMRDLLEFAGCNQEKILSSHGHTGKDTDSQTSQMKTKNNNFDITLTCTLCQETIRGAVFTCSRCKSKKVVYCTRRCKSLDWDRHRDECFTSEQIHLENTMTKSEQLATEHATATAKAAKAKAEMEERAERWRQADAIIRHQRNLSIERTLKKEEQILRSNERSNMRNNDTRDSVRMEAQKIRHQIEEQRRTERYFMQAEDELAEEVRILEWQR